jgi:hypothetical protein
MTVKETTTGASADTRRSLCLRAIVVNALPELRLAMGASHFPPMAAARSWYRRTGGGGVIARFRIRAGIQFKTP